MRVAPVGYLQKKVAAGPYPALPYEADLFSRWNFNEGTGTTAYDLASSGVDLTAINADILSNQTPGIFSGEYCADFTGGNNRSLYNVTAPYGCLDIPFTWNFWIKFDSTPSNRYIGRVNRVSTGCFGTEQSALIVGYVTNTMEAFSFVGDRFTIQSPVPLGQWQMLTMTYDGNNTTGSGKIYVDGTFIASNTGSGSPRLRDMILGGGGESSAQSNSIDGYIDECTLYDFNFSSTQVTELYNWYVNNPKFVG